MIIIPPEPEKPFPLYVGILLAIGVMVIIISICGTIITHTEETVKFLKEKQQECDTCLLKASQLVNCTLASPYSGDRYCRDIINKNCQEECTIVLEN